MSSSVMLGPTRGTIIAVSQEAVLESEGIERLHDLVLLAVLHWKGAVAIRPRHNLHRDYRRSSFANAFR